LPNLELVRAALRHPLLLLAMSNAAHSAISCLLSISALLRQAIMIRFTISAVVSLLLLQASVGAMVRLHSCNELQEDTFKGVGSFDALFVFASSNIQSEVYIACSAA
jgi:hypothetical protein